MTPQRQRLTQACAELIRLWHLRYGVVRPPSHMNEARLLRYKERVDHFHQADLSDPHAQREVAREQQAGVFEWSYVQTIPADLWSAVTRTHEISNHHPPEHLGEAARWILDSLQSADLMEPSPEDKSRLIVEADTRARLLEQAGEFYADIVAEQRAGIGGLNVLLSCSLERYPWDAASDQRATLLRPEVLGLRVAVAGERSDDFIDAIRQGELIVEATTGGPTEPIPRSGEDDDSAGER